MGTPAELKQQFGGDSIDEVFVRLARPTNEPAVSARPDTSGASGG